jgi:hypothetical protein
MPKSILLLFIAWLSFYSFFYELIRRETDKVKLRDIFLLAAISWGVAIVLITEGLSIFHLIQRDALIISWIVATSFAFAGTVLLFLKRTKPAVEYRSALKHLIDSSSWKNHVEIVMLGFIIFQILTLAMVAYQYAPNTWDAMTYHLSRVVHWQQNQTIAPYATNIERQVQMPPFAEFILLNLQVLILGDRFANFVQWGAMVVSIIGVSNITEKLGANKYQQILAGLLCAFIPAGILQATSTQNDYVLSACLVCMVSFLFSMIKNPKSKIWVIAAGSASGLALLTKGTAYVYIPAFIFVFGLIYLKKQPRKGIFQALIIIFITVMINSGYYLRNFSVYHSPLGPTTNYQNELKSPSAVVSVAIRNVALHIPINTPIAIINNISEDAVSWLRLLHQFTRLSPTDPRTTLGQNVFSADAYAKIATSYDEDYTGNTLHFILILMAMLAAIASLKNYQVRAYTWLMLITLVFSFLLFSTLLKWQIWGSRLQLPMFVLWCVVIPIFLFRSQKTYIQVLPILLCIYLFNWTFANETRPINLDATYASKVRSAGYFTKKSGSFKEYQEITNLIEKSKCANIGLAVTNDMWEYPLWMIMSENGVQARIEHILVNNPTKTWEDPNFVPCAIVTDRGETDLYFQDKMPVYQKSLTLYLTP